MADAPSSAPSNAPVQLKWHLSHVRGYIELGLLKEAAAELEQIPAGEQQRGEVLEWRIAVFMEMKAWPEARDAAAQLCQRHPDRPGGWISLAYATRRADSLEEAEAILLAAEKIHPSEPTILFNLGCYACQRGDLASARARVKRAIAIDSHFQFLAANDPDLAPLRAEAESE